MKNKFPTMLIILDGVGYREQEENNAVAHAHMPHFFKLLSDFPSTTLKASGSAIGLPEEHNGNSELGHLTIGCGTIIKQPLTLLEEAFQQKKASEFPMLKTALSHLIKQHKTLHIMGLLSDANIHSSIHHLYKFLEAAKELNVPVVIHPFLDGEDVEQGTAFSYLKELDYFINKLGTGIIGSIHGRFYAMDKNNNWHLTEQSYRILTEKQSHTAHSWKDVLNCIEYKDLSENYIPPTQLTGDYYVKPGDSILFFNFKPDRARQLTKLFLTGNGTTIKPFPLTNFITPVSYGSHYETTILFQNNPISQTLTGILNEHEYSFCTIAETEKFPYITYYFNGGREHKLEHETRIVITSHMQRACDYNPAMQADIITEATLSTLKNNPHDFYIINYANADVISRSGNFNATIKALEHIDKQIGLLFDEIVIKRNGILVVTSDHGKAEDMSQYKNLNNKTNHNTNPVYFTVAKQDLKNQNVILPLEQLSDIAPFIAHLIIDQ